MIPYVREMDFEYGRPDQVSPLIRRVVANNPGPFTFRGTGTYIVGSGEVAVIDPGPADPAHLQALLAALEGEQVHSILTTHDHSDHAPLAADLARHTGAPVIGARPTPGRLATKPGTEEGSDRTYRPDRVLEDGETVSGPGWNLQAVATPGHTGNHLCYALAEENALFSGDHVMGWSTTVIVPPDGSMTDYYASLRKVMASGYAILWPTHGPPITDPAPFLEAYLEHRLKREGQILELLERGPSSIPQMVARLYAGLDPRLHRAAGASLLAHLTHLIRAGRVTSDGREGAERSYRITTP
ncbi:MAG TPA: MBL fold metallo-hydrolase [Caulobacteraceae bacterium]|nr:MBL fold metallo-hydrolase [Caulobacteraceae bacterium]